MTTEFHREGSEGEGMSESHVRKNFTLGSMRGNRKKGDRCSLIPYSTQCVSSFKGFVLKFSQPDYLCVLANRKIIFQRSI